MPNMIGVFITDSLKTLFYVSKETYKKVRIGDTILLRVSSRGGMDYKDLHPTHEEIERYKVPQHYIARQ